MQGKLLVVVAVIVAVVIFGAVALSLYKPTPPPPETPTELVISHWGFGWDNINKIVIEPFEKKYNVKVVLISGTTAERYAKLAEGAEPIPDIVFLPDYYMYRAAKEGLLDELDLSKISNYNKIYKFIRDALAQSEVSRYGVPHTIQDMLLFYRSDIYKPVVSVKDLWRPEFRGYIALPDITTTSGPLFLTITSVAFGGSVENAEPGFKALEQLKGGVVTFYTRSADLNSLFERKEIYIAPGLRYQAGSLQNINTTLGGVIKYVIPEEGSIFTLNLMAIPKGAKHKDLAYKLIDFWLSTEVQKELAEAGVDAPINAEVKLPQGHYFDIEGVTKKPIYIKPEILASKLQEWIDEWKARVKA